MKQIGETIVNSKGTWIFLNLLFRWCLRTKDVTKCDVIITWVGRSLHEDSSLWWDEYYSKAAIERKRANARLQHPSNDFQFISDNTIKKTIELGIEGLVKQSLLLFRDLCENVHSLSWTIYFKTTTCKRIFQKINIWSNDLPLWYGVWVATALKFCKLTWIAP